MTEEERRRRALLQFGLLQGNGTGITQKSRLTSPKVSVARPQTLYVNNTPIKRSPTLRTGGPVYKPKTFETQVKSIVDSLGEFGSKPRQTGTAIGLGAVRSGVGLGQSFSGLYDLATPGKGTNRFSKYLDSRAKFVDETARNEGVNQGIYKGGQFATDILSLALGGAGLVKLGTKAPQVIPGASRALNAFDRAAEANKAVKGVRFVARPNIMADEILNVASGVGQRASKGQDVTAQDVAIDTLLPIPVGIAQEKALTKVARDKLAQQLADSSDFKQVANTVYTRYPNTNTEAIADAITSIVNSKDQREVSNILKSLDKAKTPATKTVSGVDEPVTPPKAPQTEPKPQSLAQVTAPVKSREQIEETVRLTYPDLDEIAQKEVTDQLVKTTDEKTTQEILEAARKRQDDLRAQTEALVPDGAQTNAQKADEAIEENRPEDVPVQAISGNQADIEQAQLPQDIDEMTRVYNEGVKSQQESLKKPNIFRRIQQSLVDEGAPLAKLDYDYAEKTGKKLDDVPANERLSHLYDRVLNSSVEADQFMKDSGLYRTIQEFNDKENTFGLYGLTKFALEVADKYKKNILPVVNGRPMSYDEAADYVRQYELRRPDAEAALRETKVNVFDNIIDNAVEAKIFSRDAGEAIKGRYEFFVPLNRILPEELDKPGVLASPTGTLGRQTIIQNIEGSPLPADNSFAPYLQRIESSVRQINRNKLANKYRERVEGGVQDGAQVSVTSQQLAQRSKLQDNFRELQDVYKSLKTEIGKGRIKLSNQKKNSARADSAAVKRAKQALTKSVDDPDAKAAISGMSRDDLMETFKLMEDMGEPNTRQIGKTARNQQGQTTELQAKIDTLRSDLQAVASAKSGNRQEFIDIAPDSTTGKQVITGQFEGFPFKIETSPEIYKVLQGTGKKDVDFVTSFAREVARPFRAAFTGWPNLYFALKSFVHYDKPASFVNSQNGIKTLVSPAAWKSMVGFMEETQDFQAALNRSGALSSTGSRLDSDLQRSAEFIAAQKSFKDKAAFFANPKNAKQTFRELDRISGALVQANRRANGMVAYERVYGEPFDISHYNANPQKFTEAMAAAVEDFNNVLPNYSRMTVLAKTLDAYLPYFAPSIAGTRSGGVALRRRPLKTAGKLAASVIAPGAALTAYSLSNSHDKQDFYEDMIKSDKAYVLDNNLIIVTPFAEKDPKTGHWSGVIMLPVAPEYRAINRAVWRQTRDAVREQKLTDPRVYAGAMFDTVTGGTVPVGFTPEKGVQGRFAQSFNPAANLAYGLATNTNPRTGNEIITEDMENKPKNEQVTNSTGGIAKFVADTLNMSPAKVQYIFDSFGTVGGVTSGKTGVLEPIKNTYVGAFGDSAGRRFYRDVEDVANTIKNPQDRAEFEANFKKDNNESYLDKTTYWTNLDKSLLSDNKEVYNAYKELDKRARERDGFGNPFFDLAEDQAQVVTQIQRLTSGDPGNVSAEARKVLLKNKDWLLGKNGKPGYYDNLSAFYDKVKEKLPADKQAKLGIDPAGIKYVVPSDDLQAKFDKLEKITDSAEKAKFYENNPDVIQYYQDTAKYRNDKRAKLRLPLLDDYPQMDKETEKLSEFYNNLPKGDGPKGGNRTRSQWIKANQGSFKKLTDYWNKLNKYQLAKSGSTVIFQGIDFDKKDLKNIGQLAKSDEVKKAMGDATSGKSGWTSYKGKDYYVDEEGNEYYVDKDGKVRKSSKRLGLSALVGSGGSGLSRTPQIDTTPNTPKLQFKIPKASKPKKITIKL